MRIGMAQILVFPESKEKNLDKIAEFVERASKEKCDLVVFPECADLGWANPNAGKHADPIPGDTSNSLCKLAREYGIFIVCGLTERKADQLYNTAILINDGGQILLKHRKINLLSGIEEMYSVGEAVRVVDTKYGKIGVSICADNLIESDVIGHTLGRMGCQLLVSPSSWAVSEEFLEERREYGKEWIVPYKILSQTYQMAVIGVSNVGEVPFGVWRGRACIGNSIAVYNGGKAIKILPFGRKAETLEVVEVELQKNRLQGTALSEKVFQSRMKKI